MGRSSVSEPSSKPLRLKRLLLKRLHILEWLPHYTKSDILADFISGLTVGLTMMPQSLAYAGLAGVAPQYGLYTAFIGSFTYVFFGTIKEVSIGPTSLMSLLTFSFVQGGPIELVILLAFIAGCVELLMGVFHLGFLVDFISPCLTSGFTSASAVIIIVAQMKNLLGIKIHSHDTFQVIKELSHRYDETSKYDAILGCSCILLLLCFKQLNKLTIKNEKLKKTVWFLSISKNALIVLLASVLAANMTHDGVAPFRLTGSVPKGMPAFGFPSLTMQVGNETLGLQEMITSLGSGIIVVPVIAVLANVAIAKAYTVDTVVDASQEMISLGLCNIFGSFVKAMPSCGAFTRSSVASSSDVRTPLQGVYSGTVIVLALSFLAPYFYFIPKATLAAVLMVAASSLIDYQIFLVLWKYHKLDFVLTLATFAIGIVKGVETAVVIGATCNALALLKEWTRPKIKVEIRHKSNGEASSKYLYIQPELGLLYPGADYVSEFVKKQFRKNEGKLPVVLDCSNILRLDYTTKMTLENLLKKFNKEKTDLMFTNVQPNILKLIDNTHLKTCDISDDVVVKFDAHLPDEEKGLL